MLGKISLTTLLLFGGLIGLSAFAQAQGADGSSQMQAELEQNSLQSAWSASASITSETNAYSVGGRDDQTATTFAINPTYKLNKETSLSLSVSGTQLHTQNKLTKVNDSFLTYSQKIKKIDNSTQLTGGVRLTLPTDYRKRDDTSFITAIRPNLTLSRNTSVFKVPTNIALSSSYTRNFHRFERNASDLPNTEQALTTTGSLIMSKNNWSLGLSAAYIYASTYQGVFLDTVVMSQELAYNFTSKTSLALGHSNAAPSLEANGESNIRVFDERSSSFYASLSHSF